MKRETRLRDAEKWLSTTTVKKSSKVRRKMYGLNLICVIKEETII